MVLVCLFEDRSGTRCPMSLHFCTFLKHLPLQRIYAKPQGRTFQFAVFEKGQANSRLSHDSSLFPIFSASSNSFSCFKICLDLDFCISRHK